MCHSMAHHLNKFFLLLIIVLQIKASRRFNQPLWTWDCINGKCLPVKATISGRLQSLITCNMLCTTIQLWPQPTGSVSLSTTAVPVRADLFQLQVLDFTSQPVLEHLQNAFDIFRQELSFTEEQLRGFDEWYKVVVRVRINGSGDPRMRLDTDERYALSVQPEVGSVGTMAVYIIANSFCGARHALETLTQLIWLDPYAGSLLMLEAASIQDAPRFRYRGLMIDTVHNYFPVEELLRTIDAMATCKLNTFHWHATGAQAFSIMFNSVPQINVPAQIGQAWDWGPVLGLGHLAYCSNLEPWYLYCDEPPCGQLNPRNDHIYNILERLFHEVTQLTGVDDLYHIGGDGMSDRCWTQYFNNTEPMDLWINFTRKTLHSLQKVNGNLPKLTLIWSSQLCEKIKTDLKEYVNFIGLQARNVAWNENFVSGLRTVLSNEDVWDLNSGMGAWHEDTEGAPYNSWEKIYEYRPWASSSLGLLEGGEATVWSATLSSGGLEQRVWPRAAALAERLWSDRPEGATRPVQARLDVYRMRLNTRYNVKAEPIWSMWCTHNTYSCL
ncbi:PREDICTED: probable beta-hexosaminidase fdl [Papilio polytes]|uniref:probable beta-hexosaminidase fdl n=1 Tax=Papilio polytes TaxID=76194 RepID=UPI00067616DC|nr:PREDICTED: probable beta-hexosaminidase fdl [Papilio polytes]